MLSTPASRRASWRARRAGLRPGSRAKSYHAAPSLTRLGATPRTGGGNCRTPTDTGARPTLPRRGAMIFVAGSERVAPSTSSSSVPDHESYVTEELPAISQRLSHRDAGCTGESRATVHIVTGDFLERA